jgi:hypothetical protein
MLVSQVTAGTPLIWLSRARTISGRLVPERRSKQHNGVNLPLVGVEQGMDVIEVLIDVDQHHDQPLRLELFRKLLQEGQLVRVAKVIDQDRNLVGQIGRQAPGQEVGGVVQLLRGLEHLRAGFFGDRRTGREGAHDGPLGNASSLSNLLRRRPSSHWTLP